jgi:tetratricopeptide (TPR) repeat protein
MPAETKPKRKTPAKRQAAFTMPDRAAMEAYLAANDADTLERDFTKAEAITRAAWDTTTARSCVTQARKAISISPLCADAYNILARDAVSLREARDLYARGVDAGELVLGPENFEACEGEFWRILETRPYMRARHGLALMLLKLGEEDAAIGHLQAMLKLNPGDNQGIRYELLSCLLRRDDLPAVKALLADYSDEWSLQWLYTGALIAYREGKAAAPATRELLKDARSANAHVPAMLARTVLPKLSGHGYHFVGSAEEASDYVAQCGPAWHKTEGAVAWLAASA